MAIADPALPPVIVLPEPSSPWSVPSGWHVQEGFEVPHQPWDLTRRHLICHGSVADESDVTAAVTVLARGVGLAVHLAVVGDLRFRALEDLHQLGDFGAPATGGGDELDVEQRRLIAALVDGATVTDAARQLNMSRRTASRRLFEIRTALGVTSTAEAISRWAEQT